MWEAAWQELRLVEGAGDTPEAERPKGEISSLLCSLTKLSSLAPALPMGQTSWEVWFAPELEERNDPENKPAGDQDCGLANELRSRVLADLCLDDGLLK